MLQVRSIHDIGYQTHSIRCTSTGRTCDGYAEVYDYHQIRVLSRTQQPPLSPRKSISVFSDFGDNMHHLEFYFHRVGPKLSGRFDSQFWSRIVLQMAHSEFAVRSALIALGDLSRHESGTLVHARRSAAANCDHERRTFWLHYNKAIRTLVSRMSEPSYTAEVGLVTCLLFVCIEFLRADAHTALAHIRNGLNLVSEVRQTYTTSSTNGRDRLAQKNSSIPMNLIENTLASILTQGLASALVYGVSVETDFAFLRKSPQHFSAVKFVSIGEARSSFWDLRNAAILLARNIAVKLYQAIPPAASDFQGRNDVLALHLTWFKALLGLENSRHLSAADRLAISALKVGYYSSYSACACLLDTRQMSFDSQLDNFKLLLLHAQHLVNAPKPYSSRIEPLSPDAAANFTFDTSLVPALFYTAMRCRCPIARREAVKLLSLELPREGLWDVDQHYIVAKRIIEIEEVELDERGWPAERTRLWSSNVGTDVDEHNSFLVSFLFAKDLGAAREKTWSEQFALGERVPNSPSPSNE
ncbi:hypothetical protein EKO04_001706 [Ascochyta lentis]|uniref:C6 zinc finger domain protein n=1 Tax=Ascochyta lentis TaxID=205686 RepID=A0A8H7MMH5_9PLEO|nr:hypothetical protein EKO04_001706 [Ascochyta lentis]